MAGGGDGGGGKILGHVGPTAVHNTHASSSSKDGHHYVHTVKHAHKHGETLSSGNASSTAHGGLHRSHTHPHHAGGSSNQIDTTHAHSSHCEHSKKRSRNRTTNGASGEMGQAGGAGGASEEPGDLVSLTGGRTIKRLVPVELDEAAQEKADQLQLSGIHFAKLDGIYRSLDAGGTTRVFCSEVLAAVGEPKSPFADHVFEMIGVNPEGTLRFTDLCLMLMTYCVYSRDDILRFLFRQYDTDDSGAIDEHEFRELAKAVNNASPMFPGNFAKAMKDFDVNSDGLIDFEEFRAMDKAFPLLFHPAFRLQDALQNHFLGNAFWTKTRGGLVIRQLTEEYKACHGGKPPDKRTLQDLSHRHHGHGHNRGR